MNKHGRGHPRIRSPACASEQTSLAGAAVKKPSRPVLTPKKTHHLAVLSADVTPDAGPSPPLPQRTLQRYFCNDKASLSDVLSSCESKPTGSFMLVLAAIDVSSIFVLTP